MVIYPPFFTDKDHRYFNEQGDLMSVSKLTSYWKPPFDGDTSSKRVAVRELDKELYEMLTKGEKIHWSNPKLVTRMYEELPPITHRYFNERSQELQLEWKDKGLTSADYGTETHFDFEHYHDKFDKVRNIMDGQWYTVIKRPTGPGYDNKFILHELLKLKKNLYISEAIVYDPTTGICGQVDKLWLYWTGSYYIAYIGDYKTDKEINFNPLWGEKGPFRFKRELGFFKDTNFWYYTVKMNIYASLMNWMGIKTEAMYLYHIPKEGKEKIYSISLYPQHIENILNLMRKKMAA